MSDIASPTINAMSAIVDQKIEAIQTQQAAQRRQRTKVRLLAVSVVAVYLIAGLTTGRLQEILAHIF